MQPINKHAQPVTLIIAALACTTPATAQSDAPSADAEPTIITCPDHAANEQDTKPTIAEMERSLKKLRYDYFRKANNADMRTLGIEKLRTYTDPVIFPSLLEIFQGEHEDVQHALLDHLLEQQRDEADAVLAWAGVFSDNGDFRQLAWNRLEDRINETGHVSDRIKSVLARALRSENNNTLEAAANMASALKIYQAIPMLINAQVAGGGGGGGTQADDESPGALADIIIGTQQAFIRDLTPVVGDNAVAFDPELGVVTSGVVLRVIDAHVITYRTGVHNALVSLSTDAMGGQSTAHLGWDQRAWVDWYKEEYTS